MITDDDTPRAARRCPSCGTTRSARTGRPTKRNEHLIREVITLIASGTPVKDAARCVGIDPVTLWRWRRMDGDLDKAVLAARAAFLRRQVERIDREAEEDWKAAAWLLERSEPSEWGKRVGVEVDTAPIPVVDPLTGRVIGLGEGEEDLDAGG